MLLDQGEDLLLGVDPMERYTTVKVPLPAGTTLLLTTDGLLEDDRRDPDGNLRALLSTLEDGAGDDLETLADRLLASPQRLTRHGDDIALMVARVDTTARPRLRAVPGLYVPPAAIRSSAWAEPPATTPRRPPQRRPQAAAARAAPRAARAAPRAAPHPAPPHCPKRTNSVLIG